jgi:hypothetical protein
MERLSHWAMNEFSSSGRQICAATLPLRRRGSFVINYQKIISGARTQRIEHRGGYAMDQGIAATGAARFGIGQPVRRREDDRLLRGQGRFTADVALSG